MSGMNTEDWRELSRLQAEIHKRRIYSLVKGSFNDIEELKNVIARDDEGCKPQTDFS